MALPLPHSLQPGVLKFRARRWAQYLALKSRDPRFPRWQLDPSNPAMTRYIEGLIHREDAVLDEMEAYGRARHFPLVGPEVGRLLQQLVLMTGARRVFELGSGFGYSAYWFARMLPEGGEVHATDADADNETRARDWFRRAGLEDRLRWHRGDALAAFRAETGPWDIVFNDVDKHEYSRVVDEVLPRLRPGGLLVSDNTLWHGRVLGGLRVDRDTAGILEHNRRLMEADDRVFTTLLPIRDGVTVSVKR